MKKTHLAAVLVIVFGFTFTTQVFAETLNPPKLTYTGGFKESTANNGSVTGSIKIKLKGDVFASTSYIPNLSNVPVGLTPIVTKISDTYIVITMTGNAMAHMNPNDVTNLGITFVDGAFKNSYATDVVNYNYTQGKVDFHN